MGGVELLISEITVPVSNKTSLAYFYQILLDYYPFFEYPGIYYTNTTSNQNTAIYGHIKQHFMTSLLRYVTNGIQDFVKMLFQTFGAP